MEIIADRTIRLDKFLHLKLDKSRNQMEQFIKKIGVEVNGKVVHKTSLKLKDGDRIKFEFVEAKSNDVTTEEVKNLNIEIIYEDEDILVINKPSFLVVHPAPSVKEHTLVDWLKYRGINLSTVSGEERHGIVHRIDKQTTGALVVAKNNEAHIALSAQLEDKSMGRYYLAIITPALKENLVVEEPIGRSSKNRLKMGIVERGKSAKSKFVKLVSSNDLKTELIGAKLFTGRTHQIRVHLAHLSRVIIGDSLYGFKPKIDKIGRVMLHAYLLYLIHPRSGEKLLFRAELFEDFEQLIDKNFDRGTVDEKIDPDRLIDSFNFSD